MRDHLQRPGRAMLRLLVAGAVTTAFLACGDDEATAPTDGALQVRSLTEGEDFDQNGYQYSVNNGQAQPIGHEESKYVTGLEPGAYQVRLLDIAENCSVPQEENPQTAEVVPGDTVEVFFPVSCDVLPPPGDGGGGFIRTLP
jgi:hypothetical protein